MRRAILPALMYTVLIASVAVAGVIIHRGSRTPKFSYVTLERGVAGRILLRTGISSQTSHVGDAIAGELLLPWIVDGQTVLPAGALVRGHVTQADPRGRRHHPATISLQFDRVTLPDGQAVWIETRPLFFSSRDEMRHRRTDGAYVLSGRRSTVELPVGTGMLLMLVHSVRVPVRWSFTWRETGAVARRTC
jgi:hypothetical protein